MEAVVQRCSGKKVFLEISQNSQENTCTRVSFLLKTRLWHRCFSVNFVKFLRTPKFSRLSRLVHGLRWLKKTEDFLVKSSDSRGCQIIFLLSWFYMNVFRTRNKIMEYAIHFHIQVSLS